MSIDHDDHDKAHPFVKIKNALVLDLADEPVALAIAVWLLHQRYDWKFTQSGPKGVATHMGIGPDRVATAWDVLEARGYLTGGEPVYNKITKRPTSTERVMHETPVPRSRRTHNGVPIDFDNKGVPVRNTGKPKAGTKATNQNDLVLPIPGLPVLGEPVLGEPVLENPATKQVFPHEGTSSAVWRENGYADQNPSQAEEPQPARPAPDDAQQGEEWQQKLKRAGDYIAHEYEDWKACHPGATIYDYDPRRAPPRVMLLVPVDHEAWEQRVQEWEQKVQRPINSV